VRHSRARGEFPHGREERRHPFVLRAVFRARPRADQVEHGAGVTRASATLHPTTVSVSMEEDAIEMPQQVH
jgi:hypothetical protein